MQLIFKKAKFHGYPDSGLGMTPGNKYFIRTFAVDAEKKAEADKIRDQSRIVFWFRDEGRQKTSYFDKDTLEYFASTTEDPEFENWELIPWTDDKYIVLVEDDEANRTRVGVFQLPDNTKLADTVISWEDEEANPNFAVNTRDNQLLFGNGTHIYAYSLPDLKLKKKVKDGLKFGGYFTGIYYIPANGMIITEGQDHTCALYDHKLKFKKWVPAGAFNRYFAEPDIGLGTYTYNSDGSLICSCGDGHILIMDAKKCKMLHSFYVKPAGHTFFTLGVAWEPVYDKLDVIADFDYPQYLRRKNKKPKDKRHTKDKRDADDDADGDADGEADADAEGEEDDEFDDEDDEDDDEDEEDEDDEDDDEDDEDDDDDDEDEVKFSMDMRLPREERAKIQPIEFVCSDKEFLDSLGKENTHFLNPSPRANVTHYLLDIKKKTISPHPMLPLLRKSIQEFGAWLKNNHFKEAGIPDQMIEKIGLKDPTNLFYERFEHPPVVHEYAFVTFDDSNMVLLDYGGFFLQFEWKK